MPLKDPRKRKKYMKKYWKELQKRTAKKCPGCGKNIDRRSTLCHACSQFGPLGSNWKGGRKRGHGYYLVWMPNHPNAELNGYILEHRLVMERHLGRTLLQTETVHHIDGDGENNEIENLMLFSTRGEHVGHHNHLRSMKNRRKK